LTSDHTPPPTTTAGALLTVGDVLCDEYDHAADEPCMELSRFHVVRSDGDESFGPGESCEAHLAAVVAGMINGENSVDAVVCIRWDAPVAVTPADLAGLIADGPGWEFP
jgi:hypothetical protein